MQHERRHNPYPFTWEIPLAIACLVPLTLAVGVHVGHGLAQLPAGHGWTWPSSALLFRGVPSVLANAAGPELAVILTVELVVTVVLVWATAAGLQRWGPTRLKGMATREQAEQVLGVRRLKRVAPVVRPDLHPGRRPAGVRR